MARNRGDRAGDWENLGTSHLDLERSRPIEHGLRRGLGRFSARGSRWGMTGWSSATLVLLLALAAILTVRGFSRLELPPPLAHPLLPILLVALILFSALRSYTLSLRALAFSRRFVRPGLRNLLEREAETLSRGEKLFRGHRSVVLKIDVEGFTFLTHDMPYGMRRLFVDLWYTLVDEVVARDVFFDKSLGDGSLYCFDAEERPHAARAALEAALRIRDTTVPRFDRVFRARLRDLLDGSSALRRPAEEYFERYRLRAGTSFWDRSTSVRIALVSGHVDEGLWGLSAQSHYDVQGPPVILASRLEQSAGSGEIVVDEAFVAALEGEVGARLHDELELEPRTVDVRGIGERRVFTVGWRRPTEAPAGAADEPADAVGAELATIGLRDAPLGG
jgi:class 3 adenylate cyclase